MAYSYFPATYQPMIPQAPVAPAAPHSQPQPGLIWVQGEAGAKSYLVAPNTTVLLMDSENEVFYIKSSDASGMPLPLRVFDYKERQKSPDTTVFSAPSIDMSTYITREEFNKLQARIDELTNKEDA